MEGQGVVNYDASKPAYGFSAGTTEFDDALIKHGIVTHEQALLAKGASAQEAARLTKMAKKKDDAATTPPPPVVVVQNQDDDDDYDYLLDDDDGFMDRYRQQRIDAMKQSSQEVVSQGLQFDQAIRISRDEWTRHVNDASQKVWVVVCLTSSDTERTGCTEQAIQQLALILPKIKFVLIPSHQAIPNWPHENLPSLFLYRNGEMKQQLVKLDCETNATRLQTLLEQYIPK